MKQKLFYVCLFVVLSGMYGQNTKWQQVTERNATNTSLEFRKNTPSEFKIYTVNIEDFKNDLFNLNFGKQSTIDIPTEKGVQRFYIEETSNFSSILSAKFPMVKSYTGKSIDNNGLSARFSIGSDGFHAVIYAAGKPTYYIDPYTKDKKQYIAYSRSSLPAKDSTFECEVETQVSKTKSSLDFQKNSNDGLLRTYRIAIVCSGEYAQYHINNQGVASTATDEEKKAAVLSAMNTSMTRINGVYERDLGVRMELVDNNDEIIFLDADTDNITDGNADTMINEVQTICDASIGTDNYDIGHIFSIGGSGLASLGVVCVTGQKARGVTGIATPIGDPYDIDYVSHEIGHQFGATHTQNNDCNRTNSTAVEPGSASTIMGYAGICAPNVQNNSDDHFHAVSIDQMWAIVTSSANCAVTSSIGNNPPTANAGEDYTVPKSTPLVLKGIGTDPDEGNIITYNWEQTDNETATMPPLATNVGGPLFRSNPSSTQPNRYLPALETVISGSTASEWEVIPSVAREINFSLVVRDNVAGGGNSDRDDMVITVDENAGPFAVTSQTTETTWYVGTTQAVTWNVAGTDTGNINVSTVNILLSTDGGLTFPTILASNVANDGLENIVVPEIGNDTTTARIIVEANENIFYAVNNTNFSIEKAEFIMNVENPVQEICLPTSSITYPFTYTTFSGFNASTTFSVVEVPSTVTATFSPTTASSNGTEVVLTLSGIDALAIGQYEFKINGTSGSISKEAIITLNVFSGNFDAIVLTAPENASTTDSLNPTFSWEENTNADSYEIQVSDTENFTNIIESGEVEANSYSMNTVLEPLSTYFWRIRAKNNCATSDYSTAYSFITSNCSLCESTGNTTYNTSTTLVKFNTINKSSGKTSSYSDYTSTSTTVFRDSSHDLSVNVNTDGNYQVQTKVWIDWNQNCSFDDEGEEYDLGLTGNVSNGATTNSPLSVVVPSSAAFGNTTMRVSTKFYGDGEVTSCEQGFDGEVEDYTINVGNLSNLPNNITVNTTSESCVDLNDGIIRVNASLSLGYTATITSSSGSQSEQLTGSSVTFSNLTPDTYSVCVAANELDYTQCFEVIIEEANPISLKIAKNEQSRSYNFEIKEGTAPFEVYLNNKLLNTFYDSNFSLEIKNSGYLEVKTAKDCEGKFNTSINDVFIKQNPVTDFIELDLPLNIEASKVMVTVFDVNGKQIINRLITKQNNTLRIPFSEYNAGIYILHVAIEGTTPIKILK